MWPDVVFEALTTLTMKMKISVLKQKLSARKSVDSRTMPENGRLTLNKSTWGYCRRQCLAKKHFGALPP